MTTSDSAEETLLKGSNFEEDEDEEEEALSLSDLPLNLINEDDNHNQSQAGKQVSQVLENEEEFNFGSWGGSLSTESEMCAADDVFFKGQILPLRLSVSSDSGLSRFEQDSSRKPGRCLFRSESMDRGSRSSSSLVGLTSVNSSRSSSTRSHYSSSSNSSCTTTTNNTTRNSRPRIRNHFHTYPSPKPQIRVSNSRLGRNGSGSRSQIRTRWDLFRLGLVRAPEIELQDLKLRNNNNIANRSLVSRNSSSGSSTSNSSSSVKNKQELEMGKQRNKKQSFLDKKLGLFSGCKCSITAVETVPLNNIVIIKSEADESSKNNINESSAVHGMEKKLQELKIKKKTIKEKQQGKQAMSRHRTFEWLKELSHASYVDGNVVVE